MDNGLLVGGAALIAYFLLHSKKKAATQARAADKKPKYVFDEKKFAAGKAIFVKPQGDPGDVCYDVDPQDLPWMLTDESRAPNFWDLFYRQMYRPASRVP